MAIMSSGPFLILEPIRVAAHADRYLMRDHLVRLLVFRLARSRNSHEAGYRNADCSRRTTVTSIPKMPASTLDKLVHQARLQKETRELRKADKDAKAKFDILPSIDDTGRPVGLGAIPEVNPGDVYFDMEGFPLIPGGLEYLFGNTTVSAETGEYEFTDFWAHDVRVKAAFETS